MPTITPAQPFQSNSEHKKSYRIIGSLDINGRGMEHPIHDVDPFVFLDETCLSGNEPWPFPKHPHSGLVAMTYLLEGDMVPWDSRQGKSTRLNRAGGFYWIDSGRGILHEEEPVYRQGSLRWLQLWLNPGLDIENRPEASAHLVNPEDIPILEDETGSLRLIVGEFDGLDRGAQLPWPIQYLHLKLLPGAVRRIPLIDTSWSGFVYCLHGEGQVMGSQIRMRELATWDKGEEDIIIENSSRSDFELVLAQGKPHLQPFYKILVGGGALIEPTVKSARDAMKRFETNPEGFGLSE